MLKFCGKIGLIIFCFISCSPANQEPQSEYRVNIRLSGDPGRINPMFAGSSAVAREIYPYLFLQLGEYNPKTLELEPILAVDLPKVEQITEGEFKGGLKMDFEILPEAVWEDGRPITGEDYLFTLKAVHHPLVNAARWRSILNDIVDVKINSINPKIFSVVFKENYLLATEAAMSFELFPKHVYDPKSVLDSISLNDLLDGGKNLKLVESDSVFQQFAQQFNSLEFNIENCSGAGPYKLMEWESGQYILLKKKEQWWGDAFPERPFLSAFPNELFFQIIPDETNAITQLKAGGIDVMSITNGQNFMNLQETNSEQGDLSFFTPQLTQYYYLGLNNRHPFLREKEVRKALAHLLDVDEIIETMEFGQAVRVIGTIPRYRENYHDQLPELKMDLALSRDLLTRVGWQDSDGNGIVDKNIDGQVQNLVLRIFVSQSELGERISLLMKENARQVGIDLQIVQKAFSAIYRENILKGDYEMATLVLRQSLSKYDPYARWHSDHANVGGSNLSGFSNPKADSLIEKIQDTENTVNQTEYYRQLQEIMYEEQPVIFLYSPVSRIVVRNSFDPVISVKRPGYFVNLFRIKK